MLTKFLDRLSFSGDMQDLPGCGPVQPALGDPALAGGLDWVTHRGPFQHLTFCDRTKNCCLLERAGLLLPALPCTDLLQTDLSRTVGDSSRDGV